MIKRKDKKLLKGCHIGHPFLCAKKRPIKWISSLAPFGMKIIGTAGFCSAISLRKDTGWGLKQSIITNLLLLI